MNSMLNRQTFKRDERLKSGKIIKMLFAEGNTFMVHPFRVSWLIRKEKRRYPARLLISVSKRNFRKASERNHIKRLCREAYRKNKHILYSYLEERNIQCDFSMIYIARTQEGFQQVEKKINDLLRRLVSELEHYPHQNTSQS